jgi:hypothetical protein
MKGSQRLVASVACTVSLSGCVLPLPHRDNLTPMTRGELHLNEVPLSDVPVRVSVGGTSCGEPYREAVTNQNGCFEIQPVKDFAWFIVVMGHSTYAWDVCVQRDGVWQVIHSDEQYTIQPGPTWPQILLCDSATEGGGSLICVYDGRFENSDEGTDLWRSTVCE